MLVFILAPNRFAHFATFQVTMVVVPPQGNHHAVCVEFWMQICSDHSWDRWPSVPCPSSKLCEECFDFNGRIWIWKNLGTLHDDCIGPFCQSLCHSLTCRVWLAWLLVPASPDADAKAVASSSWLATFVAFLTWCFGTCTGEGFMHKAGLFFHECVLLATSLHGRGCEYVSTASVGDCVHSVSWDDWWYRARSPSLQSNLLRNGSTALAASKF